MREAPNVGDDTQKGEWMIKETTIAENEHDGWRITHDSFTGMNTLYHDEFHDDEQWVVLTDEMVAAIKEME